MERGPMALFGAIIAVGLGPALWLGAQFGTVDVTPVRPPGLSADQDPAAATPGGVGAADTDPVAEVRTGYTAPGVAEPTRSSGRVKPAQPVRKADIGTVRSPAATTTPPAEEPTTPAGQPSSSPAATEDEPVVEDTDTPVPPVPPSEESAEGQDS